MLLRKAFKFKLYPLPEAIERDLARALGCARFIWNRALAAQKERLEAKGPLLSYEDLANELPGLKKEPATAFLKEAPSQALQQKLKDFDRALLDGLDPAQPHKKFPNFKKKRDSYASIRLPQHVKIEGDRAYLPTLGWVRFRKSRPIVGVLKNTTISRDGGAWFVSFQTEIELDDPLVTPLAACGIDVGVARFCTLSDGSFAEPLNAFRKIESALARAHRALAKKARGSANRAKQLKKVARLQRRAANARRDYLHKLSTRLAKTHGLVVIEDLQVKNMTASAAGTLENPGQNVRQKAGLNKAILDQGWGLFRDLLAYKLAERGGLLLKINPAYTSQTCPACGFVHTNNRRSQSSFRCQRCPFEGHADHVAAINILAAGRAAMACGGARARPGEAGTTDLAGLDAPPLQAGILAL